MQSNFGYHVIRVDERTPVPTLAELEADPLSYVPSIEYSRFFTPWFNDALRGSEITINPLVGTWFEDGLGILPPDDG